jgi:hypothetical protein
MGDDRVVSGLDERPMPKGARDELAALMYLLDPLSPGN